MNERNVHCPSAESLALLCALVQVGSALAQGCPTPGFSLLGPYRAGTNPVAVAVGYLNEDHVLDMAVANQQSLDVSILFGNGDGSFGDPTNFIAGFFPQTVAVADFNGDNREDVAVADAFSPGSVVVFLNAGGGGFQQPMPFPVGPGAISMVAADFNDDQIADLAIANSEGVSLLLSDEEDVFRSGLPMEAGSDPFSIDAGDFNQDQVVDLVVANQGSEDVTVFLGKGDGTFTNTTHYPVGWLLESVVAGDWNADQRDDVAVVHANGISVLMSKSDGTLDAPSSPHGAGTFPVDIVAADLNDDGPLDLAVANDEGVSVLMGNGNGTFQDVENFAAGGSPFALAVGDVNANGSPDLVVANLNIADGGVLILANTCRFERPELRITRSGSVLKITWPYASDGFRLESTSSLIDPDWQLASEERVEMDGQWVVTIVVDQEERYFRLHRP